MKKYFVCYRHRATLDIPFVIEFLQKNPNTKFHTKIENAFSELHKGFYDDSDYAVIEQNNNIYKILHG